jgi:hypothetical protein
VLPDTKNEQERSSGGVGDCGGGSSKLPCGSSSGCGGGGGVLSIDRLQTHFFRLTQCKDDFLSHFTMS